MISETFMIHVSVNLRQTYNKIEKKEKRTDINGKSNEIICIKTKPDSVEEPFYVLI